MVMKIMVLREGKNDGNYKYYCEAVWNAFLKIMRKSNSKQLYKLARKLKAKENNPTADDSLDVPPPPKKKAHFRSQSCPFTLDPAQAFLRERESNCLPAKASATSHKKKPSQQWSTSQGSVSSQTVIIREVPADPARAQRGKAKELLKRSMAGFKGDSFARTRVSQQIRTYQLRKELANVQKESQNTFIKQRILEGLMLRCDHEILENSFEFA